MAYGIHDYLTDGPAWLYRDCISYTFSPPSSFPGRVALQQALAAQRQLSAHTEIREMDVFVLRLPVDGTPLKIQETDGSKGGRVTPNIHSLKAMAAPISACAKMLSVAIRHPVFDETGLSGNYTFDFTWGMLGEIPNAAKTQLGLELQSTKRQVQVLKIDHAEPWPTDDGRR